MQRSFMVKGFILLLLTVVGIACYNVFRPFLGEFLIATILVTIFYTPYEQLVKLFKGKKHLASIVMCFLIILIVIIPLANFSTYTAERLIGAYNSTLVFVNNGGIYEVVEKVNNNPLLNKISFFGLDNEKLKSFIINNIESLRSWLLSEAGSKVLLSSAKDVITGTANFIISIIIVMFCMFFFFVDGRKIAEKIMYLTPLPNKYDKEIFKKFKDVSSSTLISTFVTAIVQGIIAAVGFLIVGFPIFFASITLAFASIIPYVGSALVWAPVGVYLLVIGKIWQGIFIILWGSLIISNSDNLVRAYLIKDKAGVHPLFIVFSILGGISLFGFWGVIFGPMYIAMAVTILHIYEMEYEEVLEK